MLALRPTCEYCQKLLPYNSKEAMICSFECTFCKTCVDTILMNVCPNCGGGFEKRPVRPTDKLSKFPATNISTHQIPDPDRFKLLLQQYQTIAPEKR